MEKYKIYTDGACSDNPGPMGCGIVVYQNNIIIKKYYGGYKELGTNNIAELMAIHFALEYAIITKCDKVTILSDSKYSINCITKWSNKWKCNGWKVKNADIIKQIYEKYINNKIKIKYVKAHSNNVGNNVADKLAKLAIKNRQVEFIVIE